MDMENETAEVRNPENDYGSDVTRDWAQSCESDGSDESLRARPLVPYVAPYPDVDDADDEMGEDDDIQYIDYFHENDSIPEYEIFGVPHGIKFVDDSHRMRFWKKSAPVSFTLSGKPPKVPDLAWVKFTRKVAVQTYKRLKPIIESIDDLSEDDIAEGRSFYQTHAAIQVMDPKDRGMLMMWAKIHDRDLDKRATKHYKAKTDVKACWQTVTRVMSGIPGVPPIEVVPLKTLARDIMELSLSDGVPEEVVMGMRKISQVIFRHGQEWEVAEKRRRAN